MLNNRPRARFGGRSSSEEGVGSCRDVCQPPPPWDRWFAVRSHTGCCGVTKGRGASSNPSGRFERLQYSREEGFGDDPFSDEDADEGVSGPRTEFLRDHSRTVLSRNDSPDIPFDVSVNPYRGCEHGCIYCYARPTHEYLGLSAGLDFESRIMVKEDAPELLRRALSAPSWQPQVIAMCGVTDAYQPVERRLRITRRCLEVLAEFRNPVAIVTKNHLVARDVDLLGALAGLRAASVCLTVTTLDEGLSRTLEPRTSVPSRRLQAMEVLAGAGIPVGVMVAPVIPGLTDHEIPAIIEASRRAGASFASCLVLRLPHGVAPLFEEWLEEHMPLRKAKILSRIRSLRDGQLDDGRFGTRMRGEGAFAESIRGLFKLACRRSGISSHGPTLTTASFRKPGPEQLTLFDLEP